MSHYARVNCSRVKNFLRDGLEKIIRRRLSGSKETMDLNIHII